MVREATVNAAVRNLGGNKSSEEEKKHEATHCQKGKVHSDWSVIGQSEIVEACLL